MSPLAFLILGGVGTVGIAISSIALRNLIRRPHRKRKSMQPQVPATTSSQHCANVSQEWDCAPNIAEYQGSISKPKMGFSFESHESPQLTPVPIKEYTLSSSTQRYDTDTDPGSYDDFLLRISNSITESPESMQQVFEDVGEPPSLSSDDHLTDIPEAEKRPLMDISNEVDQIIGNKNNVSSYKQPASSGEDEEKSSIFARANAISTISDEAEDNIPDYFLPETSNIAEESHLEMTSHFDENTAEPEKLSETGEAREPEDFEISFHADPETSQQPLDEEISNEEATQNGVTRSRKRRLEEDVVAAEIPLTIMKEVVADILECKPTRIATTPNRTLIPTNAAVTAEIPLTIMKEVVADILECKPTRIVTTPNRTLIPTNALHNVQPISSLEKPRNRVSARVEQDVTTLTSTSTMPVAKEEESSASESQDEVATAMQSIVGSIYKDQTPELLTKKRMKRSKDDTDKENGPRNGCPSPEMQKTWLPEERSSFRKNNQPSRKRCRLSNRNRTLSLRAGCNNK